MPAVFPSIPFSCTPEPFDEIQLTVELRAGDGKAVCSFDLLLRLIPGAICLYWSNTLRGQWDPGCGSTTIDPDKSDPE